ncbi:MULTISPECIES: hypothetical protein [unclassified Roseobacter]|uniref:hypothetical protein n=1 Tax=unclassified Roseobacter TaxID=196798 RepID=UPI001490CC38|nr:MULTISPECIES: hypothetical protein [unclassified Roseobacter]NNW38536.1 hypothetical protein [Roseobacter sp. HKCCD9117-2]NNX36541.1 hypothetical protein [Roseobacter sp. HKCCD8418]NNY43022.1 hypothetical protein [Roseobacter sp. HKCCD8831]NNY47342.1 hypothetical protein [Roseobacter sp. HKCCD8801]NNY64358.1 hypothetical protein [Roseobacter sp. HKCCD8499]NOB06959.1 hypothetical protein [Roseobacter sp. HKCCD8721]NOC38975.1 hypothetical protein [Roseobacter sp. HKCCD7389]NOD06908.1 hypot
MVPSHGLSKGQFRECIASFRDRSAAVVYGFSPSGKFTQVWYDQWRSAVISSYGAALEELGLHPYFVDAASFARQALDGSLPKVTCAFNLNAGITPIHHWSMVPSVASWCGIKPFSDQRSTYREPKVADKRRPSTENVTKLWLVGALV